MPVLLKEAPGSGGGKDLGRSLAAGLVKDPHGLGVGGAASSSTWPTGQPLRSALPVPTNMTWPVWLLPTICGAAVGWRSLARGDET